MVISQLKCKVISQYYDFETQSDEEFPCNEPVSDPSLSKGYCFFHDENISKIIRIDISMKKILRKE